MCTHLLLGLFNGTIWFVCETAQVSYWKYTIVTCPRAPGLWLYMPVCSDFLLLFTELWYVVAGFTTDLGIQKFLPFVSEFWFIRCQDQISDDMPACQAIRSFCYNVYAQVKSCPCLLYTSLLFFFIVCAVAVFQRAHFMACPTRRWLVGLKLQSMYQGVRTVLVSCHS